MAGFTDFLTTRGKAFVSAGVVLVASGLLLGVKDLTRIGVLVVALPLLAAAMTRHHRLALDVHRTVTPIRVHIEEPSLVEVAVTNTGSARTPMIMAEEYVDYALGDRPRFVVPPLRSGEQRVVRYTIRSHTRGRHRLGPVGIRVRDPFGLSSRTASHSRHTDVLVLPRVVPLTAARPKGSELGAEGAIPHVVALHGEDDVSIREYRDGDDLRRIHWPATARTGDLMVRQEDRPATRRAVIVLDSRATAHRGAGPASTLEWAVSAAASVAVHLLGLGYAIQLVTAGPVLGRAVAGDIDADAALDVLAEVEPCQPEDFAAMVRTASSAAAAGGLVVAVLAPLDDPNARAVASLRQPGSNGMAFVIDVDHARGPRPGGRDPGSAAISPTTSPAAATAAVLQSAGWAALPVSGGTGIAEAWRSVSGGERRVSVS